MYILLSALDGCLALFAQRAFLLLEHLARTAQVGIDSAPQFFGLCTGRVLRMFEKALGIADQGMKLFDEGILSGLQVATMC